MEAGLVAITTSNHEAECVYSYNLKVQMETQQLVCLQKIWKQSETHLHDLT